MPVPVSLALQTDRPRSFAVTDNYLIIEGGAQWYVSRSTEAVDSEASGLLALGNHKSIADCGLCSAHHLATPKNSQKNPSRVDSPW